MNGQRLLKSKTMKNYHVTSEFNAGQITEGLDFVEKSILSFSGKDCHPLSTTQVPGT